MFEELLLKGLWLLLFVSGLPVLVGSIAGLLVSIIQAATQVQEQSISYFVKVSAVIATLIVMAPWFSNQVSNYFELSMRTLSRLGTMP